MKDSLLINEGRMFSFENCCVVNGERWFFANELNALCSMNIHDREVVFRGSVPGENLFSRYLFADIKYYNNKIYLIPRGASALIIYNMQEHSFKRIAIKTPEGQHRNAYVEYLKFSAGVIYKNKLYMIPRTYPAIVVFDIVSEEMAYETDWIQLVDRYIFEDEAYFWADFCISGTDLLLAGANNDCILERSFITGRYTIQNIPNNNNGYSGIECVDDRLFLSSRKNGQILLVDKSVANIKLPEGFKVDQIIGFSKLIRKGNYIYAVPMWANYFIRVCLSDLHTEVIKNYSLVRNGNNEIATCCGWEEERKVCLYNNLDKLIECFVEDQIVERTEVHMTNQFCNDFVEFMKKNIQVISENELFSLEEFVNYI